MIKRLTLLVLLCLAAGVAAGCSKNHVIHVESTTCWNGTVNDDQYISGCGNSTYKVLGPLRCVRVTRTGGGGGSSLLRVRIDDRPWVDTPDPYGYVQACN